MIGCVGVNKTSSLQTECLKELGQGHMCFSHTKTISNNTIGRCVRIYCVTGGMCPLYGLVVSSQIGTMFLRGVSGGEKKRCSIGMELITSPSLLYLDEPTTGLDANTANSIMELLQKYHTLLSNIPTSSTSSAVNRVLGSLQVSHLKQKTKTPSLKR